MRRSILLSIALALGACRASHAPPTSSKSEPPPAAPSAPTLRFSELFRPGGDTLIPTEKTQSLAGKRVRLVGFMAQMEVAPRGAFFLTPQPVHCDEAGGGTADLPMESVLVLVESARGREIPWMKGPLEMTGILEVGNRADDDGRVSAFRLRLDGPLETQVAMTHETPAGVPSAVAGEKRTDAP